MPIEPYPELQKDTKSAIKRFKSEGGDWEKINTRKKNHLIKEEKYHREYSDLCDAIKNARLQK